MPKVPKGEKKKTAKFDPTELFDANEEDLDLDEIPLLTKV